MTISKTAVLFTLINPAILMGWGFSFISGSVWLEGIANKTGIMVLSLNGFLNYEKALEFSNVLHGNLFTFHLIPIIFFGGLVALFFKYYVKLKDRKKKQRVLAAMQLSTIEGIFLAAILFGGCISNIATLFPMAINNWYLVFGITIPMLFLRFRGEQIAELINSHIEKHSPRKQF